MFTSKVLKSGSIKQLHLDPEEERKPVPEWAKKVQKVFGKITCFCYNHKIPFLWRWKALDDLSEFPLFEALRYIGERFLETITFYCFRKRVGRGWAYFKQGYDAFDFDSAYAMYMFLWKLERLAKVLDANDRHYEDKQSAKQIQEVVRLINRVMKDEYVDEFEKEVTEKYGDNIQYEARTDGIWGFCNKGKGPFKNGNCVSVSLSHRREKWTPETHYEIMKAEKAKYIKAEKKKTKEWKKALKIIEEHFFEWWN